MKPYIVSDVSYALSYVKPSQERTFKVRFNYIGGGIASGRDTAIDVDDFIRRFFQREDINRIVKITNLFEIVGNGSTYHEIHFQIKLRQINRRLKALKKEQEIDRQVKIHQWD